MRKFETFDSYPGRSLRSAESALLTVWPSLVRYQEDLVLVGGLAIHYLTRIEDSDSDLPGAVTLDVDFGISIGASGGQYGTIRSDLEGLGFVSEANRVVRKVGNIALYVDFLTEDAAPNSVGSRVVDDVLASVVPGINRALSCFRSLLIKGRDIYQVEQECDVKIADIGPLLVLKLNAFGGVTGRRHPKDAYDILLAVTRFIDGPRMALEGFWAEGVAGSVAYQNALKVLEKDFSEIGQDGPARAAAFLGPSWPDDTKERIRQDTVTAGRSLLRI